MGLLSGLAEHVLDCQYRRVAQRTWKKGFGGSGLTEIPNVILFNSRNGYALEVGQLEYHHPRKPAAEALTHREIGILRRGLLRPIFPEEGRPLGPIGADHFEEYLLSRTTHLYLPGGDRLTVHMLPFAQTNSLLGGPIDFNLGFAPGQWNRSLLEYELSCHAGLPRPEGTFLDEQRAFQRRQLREAYPDMPDLEQLAAPLQNPLRKLAYSYLAPELVPDDLRQDFDVFVSCCHDPHFVNQKLPTQQSLTL